MDNIKLNNTLAKGLKIGIVVSEFNKDITQRLLNACLKELSRLDVLKKNISVVWVPGSFEIPFIAKKIASRKNIHAVICLGVVIKGETLHYELVSYAATYGIQQVALESEKPVIFEILACDTVALANKRSQEKGYNKGAVAAQTAVKMANILLQLDK